MFGPILLILFILLVIWFAVARYLAGADLSEFDAPDKAAFEGRQSFSTGDTLNEEHQQIIKMLAEMSLKNKKAPMRHHVKRMRHFLDSMTDGLEFTAQLVSVDAGGVKAEWVLAPGAESSRRTLYIHGGAWMAGSPRSHRAITNKLAELTGGAVLAIDYRLMPENPRRAGIEDCRAAYRWILDNGPDGPQKITALLVSGDSAGGNLALSTVAWARDQGLRPADAVVVLSPATDATMSGKTAKSNLATDVMLGPSSAILTRIPRSLLLWSLWGLSRIRPSDPDISPIHGDLANLPPILIHASEDEMLLDDAQRYQNKAIAAGSPVRLQTWRHVVHVWQMFDPQLTEARQAYEEIGKFLQATLPPAQSE